MNFRIPAFRLPPLVASLGSRLPQWPHALHLVLCLNAAKALKLLPEDTLEALEGRSFQVQVRDTGGTARFTYRGGRFVPQFAPTGAPDIAFSADLSTYLQLLARQEDPDTLFFSRALEITGDTELGLLIKNMLDAVEWPSLAAHLPSLPFRLPFAAR